MRTDVLDTRASISLLTFVRALVPDQGVFFIYPILHLAGSIILSGHNNKKERGENMCTADSKTCGLKFDEERTMGLLKVGLVVELGRQLGSNLDQEVSLNLVIGRNKISSHSGDEGEEEVSIVIHQ